ncbi:MAG: PspA/IM30 family protein [Bacteroidetes bacterium]|nr:MAG: PspA/IM30 family protein [Bacteroidota bacterium]
MWNRILQRLLNIFKAKANDALDKAEDPVQMMKLAIAEMELSIQKSTEALAKAMGNHKQLKNKLEELNKESLNWYGKATQAIKTNNDDLGKKALEKKSLIDQQIEQYNGMVEHSGKTVDQLKVQLDRMKTKLDEAKSKESILEAKVQNAKAHKEIGQQLGGMNYTPLAEFKKYEDKINKLEAEAESYTELAEHTDKLDREFDVLLTDSKVTSEFDAIKSDLQALEAQKIAEEKAKKEQKLNQYFDGNNKLPQGKKPLEIPQNPENKQKLIDNFFKDNNSK